MITHPTLPIYSPSLPLPRTPSNSDSDSDSDNANDNANPTTDLPSSPPILSPSSITDPPL
jgi:hypothetical protein